MHLGFRTYVSPGLDESALILFNEITAIQNRFTHLSLRLQIK